MKKTLLFLFAIFFITMAYGSTAVAAAQNPQVVFSTTKGDMVIELYADKAPISVKNFLAYVDSGFYDNVIFHRVIPGFVIQGGGFNPEMVKKTTKAPIKNEADNGLKNLRGTLSLARTRVVDSATTQFFINLGDNASLDHRAGNFGYAVFGKVVKGMDVVDTIAGVPTGSHGHYRDVPTIPVIINKATRKKP
ncbi:MAG: peptidylprolyl isomerase [Pseudomonadota bacterium]|nr:peptidylprolyl isomerase [Pseudomonadota bacterium]MEA3240111.1 peptidylprolyl isomerase [Pseudomonadota bacterium]